MGKKINCTDKFVTYGREWGKELSAQAQLRNMSRTELIKKATTEYLANNPVEDRQAA
jgi:hypothetical protein